MWQHMDVEKPTTASAKGASFSFTKKFVYASIGFLTLVASSLLLGFYFSMPYLFWGSKVALNEYKKHPFGDVLLMRHAIAPGSGDPPTFDIQDCATQRNLDAEGRQQAKDIGAKISTLSGDTLVLGPTIWTSQWCRCKETGVLVAHSLNRSSEALSSTESFVSSVSSAMKSFGGNEDAFLTKEEWGLNSFYEESFGFSEKPTIEHLKKSLLAFIEADTEDRGALVERPKLHTLLITHSVTITALTGMRVPSGGIVAYDSTGKTRAPVEVIL